jgi:ABC-type multidrug transport system fused ATPase/permease subunit
MSKEDFFKFVGWARDVPLFLKQCHSDKLDEVLKAHDMSLTAEETISAKEVIKELWEEYENKLLKEKQESDLLTLDCELAKAEKELYSQSLGITVKLLENAINDAQIAFKNLRSLSNITFFSGLILIMIAAITGLFLQKETFSLIFGGLGTLFVFTIFLMKPKEEIQIALSNLLQAEIIFLDFHNQMYFWAPYIRKATNISEKQKASEEMHNAAKNAVELLQKCLEPKGKTEEPA